MSGTRAANLARCYIGGFNAALRKTVRENPRDYLNFHWVIMATARPINRPLTMP